MFNILKKRRLIIRHEIKIIEKPTRIRRDSRRIRRKRFIRVIYEVSSCIERIRTIGETIKHSRIHSTQERIVLVSRLFSGYEDAHALPRGEVNNVLIFLSDGVDAVDFDDGHEMLIEFYEERSECGHVDYSQHVRFSGGEVEGGGGVVVEDGAVGDGFCAVGIEGRGEEGTDEFGDLFVIPV